MTARTTIRIRKLRVAGLLVATVAIAAALGSNSPVSSSSPLPSPSKPPARSPRAHHAKARGLDPALRGALHRATADAAAAGVELVVVSGWRSPAHQARLFSEAVAKYGSVHEAARWVATPKTSAHVSGDAVDVGPSAAAAWLSAHGAAYGLCQIYANEPWHYELRPEAVQHGCPPTYADPTHDPRISSDDE